MYRHFYYLSLCSYVHVFLFTFSTSVTCHNAFCCPLVPVLTFAGYRTTNLIVAPCLNITSITMYIYLAVLRVQKYSWQIQKWSNTFHENVLILTTYQTYTTEHCSLLLGTWVVWEEFWHSPYGCIHSFMSTLDALLQTLLLSDVSWVAVQDRQGLFSGVA